MNLDELIESIPEAELRGELFRWVEKWKTDESDVESLATLIQKWHGNVTFADPRAQDEFYSRYQSFRENAIRKLGGMTVNERLYWFGLFDHWDDSDDNTRARLRTKVHADP